MMIYRRQKILQPVAASLLVAFTFSLSSCGVFENAKSTSSSSYAQNYSSAQGENKDSSMENSNVQGPSLENFAYVDGENRYGNAPYASTQSARRMVTNGKNIFWGLNELRSTDMEGKNEKILWSKPVGQVSFYDGWVYFSDCTPANTTFNSSQIYRVKPDGGTPELVYQCQNIAIDTFQEFLIANDKIYLVGFGYNSDKSFDSKGVVSIDISGNNPVTLTQEPVWSIQIEGNKIYYCYADNFWSSDLKGSNQTVITKNITSKGFEYQGWVYYFNKQDGSIYRISTSGTDNQLVSENVPGDVENMFVINGELYYYYSNTNEPKTNLLYLEKVPALGSETKKILCDDVKRTKYSQLEPLVINNQIYYDFYPAAATTYDNTFCHINRIDLDGSNKIVDFYVKNN